MCLVAGKYITIEETLVYEGEMAVHVCWVCGLVDVRVSDDSGSECAEGQKGQTLQY